MLVSKSTGIMAIKKQDRLKAIVLAKLNSSDPRSGIDQVDTKEFQEWLLESTGEKFTIPMIRQVLMKIVATTEDGYPIIDEDGDECHFVMGDCHLMGDTTIGGLHRYTWFFT